MVVSPEVNDCFSAVCGRIQRVDAVEGARARVGFAALEADELADEAGAVAADEEMARIEACVGVDHDAHVHVVQISAADEFLLAAEKAALEAKAAQQASDSMMKLNVLFEQSQKTLQDMKRLIDGCPSEQRDKLNGLIMQTLTGIFGKS